MKVEAWNEKVLIPTYGVSNPEKCPMFLENRVYQGSSGAVYPYPVIEKISDKKELKSWDAVYIENQYLKIMILPQLGGRIQMAYDKIKERHFIYYNQVIKPALVGLTGPWISGGIEFNWPQHHRPSTFEPIEHFIEEHPDGSKTIWCNELERMFRTRCMIGFRLYPDKAYLEIDVRLYNGTTLPQTFLWWANPAVKVNDHYQTVFPPDVHAVYDHGKRDVSTYPIATGVYYKMDYSAGVDISRYKNIPVPTSFMAVESKYDFIGGYENDTQAGMLHVADHHIVPGKKQWTWGNGDFGQAWDRNLTDEDGPYIELMCGAFTDNQPDFSWIMPKEERCFTQYFMPYHELGVVKNANKDIILNMEITGRTVYVKLLGTSVIKDLIVRLSYDGQDVLNETFESSPTLVNRWEITIQKDIIEEKLTLSILNHNGLVILSYTPESVKEKPIPQIAEVAKSPAETATVEQLFLTGLHLEQYRHATFKPVDYYLEAIRREPGNVRANNALGLLFLRKAGFAEAELYFRKAIETLIQRNPNPYDGEPYYNLGLSLFFQEKMSEAFDAFYKATWNAAFQDQSHYFLALILTRLEDYSLASQHIHKSLLRNSRNKHSIHLKAILLRKMNNRASFDLWIDEETKKDPFHYGLLFEEIIYCSEIDKKHSLIQHFHKLVGDQVHTYIEYALDYAKAALYSEAIQLMDMYLNRVENAYPMAQYLNGYFYLCSGNKHMADYCVSKAAELKPDYCFPHRLEEAIILQEVIRIWPADAMANYYLGNQWYAFKEYAKARECWEKSKALNPHFPILRRNLALAYYNKSGLFTEALHEMENAFHLDPTDSRVLMELDQLKKKMNVKPRVRLNFLEQLLHSIESRDDLYLEYVTLQNQIGNHEKALNLLMNHKFHPWEGGEGKVTGQYVLSHISLAKQLFIQGNYLESLTHLEASERYPENLGEGKLIGNLDNEINYWKGKVAFALGNNDLADKFYEKAIQGDTQPANAIFYNDQKPDVIFYQGLALKKLGRHSEAQDRFHTLLEYAEKHKNDHIIPDYFAVSLPDLQIWEEDLDIINRKNCMYLKSLALIGKGEFEEAKKELSLLLQADSNHQGAISHLQLLETDFVFEI